MKIKELFRKGASSPSPSDKGAGSDTGAGSLRSHSDLKKTLFHSDDNYGLRILHEPAKPTIDIIFVQGLTGKSFDTWLAKSGTYWPTQLLPDDIPDARIMTFGYDADVTKLVGPVGQSNIREHASTFFRELNMVRAKDQSVSICSISERGSSIPSLSFVSRLVLFLSLYHLIFTGANAAMALRPTETLLSLPIVLED